MRNADQEILVRAVTALHVAKFGSIARSTALEYRAVASRLAAEREAAGPNWEGPATGAKSPRYAAVRRAAWARRTHFEVASAIYELRQRRIPAAAALERLHIWVPEAERCPPMPGGDAGPLHRCGRPPAMPRSTRSKRAALAELPPDWLARLWHTAVNRDFRHLDALAVLIATGCRPAEVRRGAAVRRGGGAVEVAIAGVKVRDDGTGQPWRRLVVALDDSGPAEHLAALADAAHEGVARIAAGCTPNALSMGVADLAIDMGFGRRISAYDIRHQRCADARIAFDGDLERVAAWLGHGGTETISCCGRLPRSSGIRGPRPLDAVAPRPIRRRVHARVHDPQVVPEAWS